jgi:hypothetical protein
MTIPSKKQFDPEKAVEVIRKAAECWPSSFIARSEIPKFTGGVYSVGTFANKDSEGVGVEGAFRLGRQICYPVDSLCDWLINRLEA